MRAINALTATTVRPAIDNINRINDIHTGMVGMVVLEVGKIDCGGKQPLTAAGQLHLLFRGLAQRGSNGGLGGCQPPGFCQMRLPCSADESGYSHS